MKKLEFHTPIEPWLHFNQHYLAVREMENRLPADEDLKQYPHVGERHEHSSEWKMRRHSLQKLRNILQNEFGNKGNLLELGCGNGWLSAQVASWGFKVTGIDINIRELEQAHRVFTNDRVSFAFADIMKWTPAETFDAVIIASAIQYFEQPKLVLDQLFESCKAEKVYILDTQFYSDAEKQSASERTKNYYSQKGVSEMTEHYYHHSLSDLGYPYKVVYTPLPGILRKLSNSSPFPIIELRKSK